MTPKKKRPRAGAPSRASVGAPREVRRGAVRALAYPTAREWISAAAIAAGGLLGSGCAEPVCDTSRIGELRTHTGVAVEQLSQLELSAGFESLGIATGIAPHPASLPLPGAMIMPLPLLPAPAPEPAPDPTLSGTEESGETDEKH